MNDVRRTTTAVVCDDDPMVRRIVTAILKRSGFQSIVPTPLASEAARLVADLQPDVVVLDLTLELEFGIDAIPLMRASSPRTTIVVYSSARKGKDEAREAGAHFVIDKQSISDAHGLETVLHALCPVVAS
jgi:DNA-binding response OmpR family regulator